MPRSRRRCKAGWWPGQHHRCAPCSRARRAAATFVALVLVVFVSPIPLTAQNLLHIRVVEGDGAIHSPAAKSVRGIAVEITDETGRPVDGAAVSFRMPEEGPGATFERQMRTDIRITTPDGRASVYGFHTTRLSGPFQVRITAVKNQVRAGTVISQYVSDTPVKARKSAAGPQKGSRKWMLVALVGAGAAAAGLAVGMSGAPPGASNPSAPGVPSTPPVIGIPTISVGGP